MKEKVLPRVDHGYQSFDANSGFWQIPLSTESRHLTTFINPFGRYRFNRLPAVLEEPKRLSSGLTTKCSREHPNPVDPSMPSRLPERPWRKVAVNLFEMNGHPFLQVVDYFSRYPDIAKLSTNDTISADVINHPKFLFSRHGIPECVISDSGAQFIAADCANFAEQYGFTHVTISLRRMERSSEQSKP